MFSVTFNLSSANAFKMGWPKILSSGKGLNFQTLMNSQIMSVTNYQLTKFIDRSKSKAFADGKINVNEKMKFDLGRVENIVGKGENAGYQHFLLFPQRFQKGFFSRSLKVRIVW